MLIMILVLRFYRPTLGAVSQTIHLSCNMDSRIICAYAGHIDTLITHLQSVKRPDTQPWQGQKSDGGDPRD